MKRTPLIRFFFEPIKGLSIHPISKSQADVARAIVKTKNYRARDPFTLRSYLSQVFTGRRKCGKNLADALAEVVHSHVSPKQRTQYTKLLHEAVSAHNQSLRGILVVERNDSVPQDPKQLLEAIRTLPYETVKRLIVSWKEMYPNDFL